MKEQRFKVPTLLYIRGRNGGGGIEAQWNMTIQLGSLSQCFEWQAFAVIIHANING